MASNQKYVEEIALLQQTYPKEEPAKISRMLDRHNGDVDLVRALLFREQFRSQEKHSLEEKYGQLADNLQREDPAAAAWKRWRLIQLFKQFGGDVEYVRKFVNAPEFRHQRHHDDEHDEREHSHDEHHHGKFHQKKHHGERRHGKLHHEKRHHDKSDEEHHSPSRQERMAALKVKYAKELEEIVAAGFDPESPRILRQLNKHDGNVKAVIERMNKQKERHKEQHEFQSKYADQINQLRADGVEIKNDRVLARILDKTGGDINLAKQRINERKEKHQLRIEYRQKHRGTNVGNCQETGWCRKRRELSVDERENLKRLRSAGAHGNPRRLLEIFHECNESIELTVERAKTYSKERHQRREEFSKLDESYLPLKQREDWPNDIEEVYLDGNNMMFVVDSLRRLCLNRASHKTERAIAEIAAAWNTQMKIPKIELIFDSTRQVDQVESVVVSSAQPKYRTTDEMLIDISRQVQHQSKNQRTIIVTSDRALAALLKNEGCKLVKPYHWFAHCMMVLTPDLITHEQTSEPESATVQDKRSKVRHNFDELVQRIAKIDL